MTSLDKHAQALHGLLGDLVTVTVRDLVTLWRTVGDGDANEAAIEQALKVAVPQIVLPAAGAAAEVTAQWYEEIVPDSKFKAVPFVDIPEDRINSTIGWALRQQGEGDTLTRLSGSAKRMVVDGSRQTVLQNATKEKVRWIRHAQPNACTFCKVLATRSGSGNWGYTSLESAASVVGVNTAASPIKAQTTGQLRKTGAKKPRMLGQKYHDHCRCVAIPVRKGTIYVPPDYVTDWDNQYIDARAALRKEGNFAPDIRAVISKMDELDKKSAVLDEAASAEKLALNAAAKSELNAGVRASLQRQAEKAAQKAAEAREAAARARMLREDSLNAVIDAELSAGQRDALERMAAAAGKVGSDAPIITNPRQIYQNIADWIKAEKFYKHSEAMKKGAQTKKTKAWLAAEAEWNQAVSDWLEAENTVLWLKAEKFYKKSEAMKKGAQTKKLKKWLQAEADWKDQQAQLAAQQAAQSAQAAVSNPFAALAAQGQPKIAPFNGGPDPVTLKASGKKLGGVNGAEIYVAPDGSEWVVKFTSKFINELEVAVAQLQQASGLATPDFYSLTINGKAASVQRFFDGANDAFPSGSSLNIDNLSDVDLLTLQQHQVLDWLVSNHDAHTGNWVKTKNGNLVGIDKGQAFKFFGKDKLAWDYVPVSPLGSNVPTYKKLWQQWMKGSTADLLDPGESGNPLNTFIMNLMSVDDQEFRDLFTPYAKAALAQGKLSTGDVSAFLDKLELRKGSLLEDFKAMYAKGLTEREKVVGPKPQPSGGAIQNLIGGPTPAQAVASQANAVNPVGPSPLGPFGNGAGLGEVELENLKNAGVLGSITEDAILNSVMPLEKFKVVNFLDDYAQQKFPGDLGSSDDLFKKLYQQYKDAKAAAVPKNYTLTEVAQLKADGKLITLTEGELTDTLAAAGLDSKTQKLYINGWVDEWAKQNGYDIYTSVEIPNKIDELDAAITAKKAGSVQTAPAGELTSGGPWGKGIALKLNELQDYEFTGELANFSEDAIKNTLFLNVSEGDWSFWVQEYAKSVHPNDVAAKGKLAVALFKDLKQQKSPQGFIGTVQPVQSSSVAAAVPTPGNFIDLAIQQGTFGSMDLVTIQNMISKAITNDQVGTLTPYGASELMKKLDSLKGLQTLDEDTFIKLAKQLDPSEQTGMAIAYATDLIQANYLNNLLKASNNPAAAFPQEVQDLWTELGITDAPSLAVDVDKLKKIKDLKDKFGGGGGFQPLKGIPSNNGLFLKDPQLYENFDTEIGIQYLTQDQLIQGLTKVVKDGNDALADQWIVKYASKKFDSSTKAGQLQILDEIDTLKKNLAAEKQKLKVGSPSSPGTTPQSSSSATSSILAASEPKLSISKLEQLDKAGSLDTLSETQISKSVFFFRQDVKEDLVTKWGQAKGLSPDEITAVLDKIKQPSGVPVINPTAPGGTPKWDRLALQPTRQRHKLPASVQPDPSSAPGTAANPHIFLESDTDDWKTVGTYHTDQSKAVWQSSDQAQMNVIKDYTGGGYRAMNGALRQGRKPRGTNALDAAFNSDNTLVTEDWMVFTRGDGGWIAGVPSDYPDKAQLSAQIGKEVDVPSFISTSITENPAFGGRCRIIFRVPPGTKMLYVDGVPNTTDRWGNRLTSNPNEREVVLPRDLKVRVLDVQDNTSGSVYEYDVVVEIVP